MIKYTSVNLTEYIASKSLHQTTFIIRTKNEQRTRWIISQETRHFYHPTPHRTSIINTQKTDEWPHLKGTMLFRY